MNGDCSVIEIVGVHGIGRGEKLFDNHRERIAPSVVFFRLYKSELH